MDFFFYKIKYVILFKRKSLLIYISITFAILFILFLSISFMKSFYFRNNEANEEDFVIPDNKTIYFEEKFDSYRDAFNKARGYLYNNLQGNLINTKKVKLSDKPIISVVIPCYKCHIYIKAALRSIQNQDFGNYEIIIADDGSPLETISFLEQMQKEDDRIRLLKNNKNMGTLYTRCLGTLSAKGKYILPMDADDMFLNKDVFDILVNIEIKGNFDIIIFNSISSTLKPHLLFTSYSPDWFDRNHEPNRVLFQPELGYYPTSPGDEIDKINPKEPLIHGKLVKESIYRKAINKIGVERYTRFTINGEDNIVVNTIFNVAKFAKFIPYYGYLYLDNDKSISKEQNKKFPDVKMHLYILDPLIDFTFNSQRNKKVLANYILYLFKFDDLKTLLNYSENDKKLFNSCLDRILKCEYISDEDKNEIRKRGKMLSFIKYNFES